MPSQFYFFGPSLADNVYFFLLLKFASNYVDRYFWTISDGY